MKVLVVGDVMLDVVVRPLAPRAPTSDTPSLVRLSRGGSAANVAVALAAGADHDVTYVGAGGDDAAVDIFTADLTRAGVAADLERVPGATGVVVALVGDTGERSMLTDRGVNSSLSEGHVLAAMERGCDHLHLSGYVVLDTATRPLAVRVLEEATSRGISTSLDVCSVGPLREMGVAEFLDVARRSDVLIANEEEACALAGESDVSSALATLGSQWREVVVTRGAQGAVAWETGHVVQVPVRSVEVVDTTGAGDAATGAYLARRLDGDDVAAALAASMDAAAEVVGGLGSRGQSRL